MTVTSLSNEYFHSISRGVGPRCEPLAERALLATTAQAGSGELDELRGALEVATRHRVAHGLVGVAELLVPRARSQVELRDPVRQSEYAHTLAELAGVTEASVVMALDRRMAGRPVEVQQAIKRASAQEKVEREMLCLLARDGSTRESFVVPHHDPAALTHVVEQEKARQGFARGLTTDAGDLVVGGSSPATVSLYRRGLPQPLRSVTLTMYVRNSIHGLELWPFDPPAR